MADNAPHLRTPHIRFWRSVPVLLILGAAVYILVPQITTLERSWSVVRGLRGWAVALAVLAQVGSYLGSGYTLRAILAASRRTLSVGRGALITLAAASLGLVAGGWVGAAAATYGWVKRESHDGNTAALAGTLPPLLNNVILIGVAVVGTLYLLTVHPLSRAQLIGFGLVLLALAVLALAALAGLRAPERATRLLVRLARGWAALRRRPFAPDDTVAAVQRFVEAWRALGQGRWRRPALGAAANLGFDILTLYCLFVAAGYPVSLGVLLAGYGVPFILGKLAFLIPGGVGVMEASMVALYDSLNVPNEISVVVILGYRLFSFWLPSVLGFAAAAYLSRPAPAAPPASPSP